MWQLSKTKYDSKKALVDESLFMTGNGYLGIRGCFEEGYGDDVSPIQGTYINGLYDRLDIPYHEQAYGFPQIQDKQPRIIDTQKVEILLDGESVNLSRNQHFNYQRQLDYKTGQATRSYDYMTISGKKASLSFKRLASFTHKNLFVYDIQVAYEGEIELISYVDTNVRNFTDKSDPRVGQEDKTLMVTQSIEVIDNSVYALMSTKTTQIEQATVVHHDLVGGESATMAHEQHEGIVKTSIKGKDALRLVKRCTFTDGLRQKDAMKVAKSLSASFVAMTVEMIEKEQEDYLTAYWNDSDIQIDGNEDVQSSVRFMLYQLIQSAGADEFSNVSAKGLSGEGYEGHYFWDTEIYIVPLLQITQPKRAKQLLAYRYHILGKAKERAIDLGLSKGATYPWRTISGVECSSYFPAGTAQYHINSDIAYAFIQYFLFNKDDQFMLDMGFEVIAETARVWTEIGHYFDNTFRIDMVTGPDEYTATVNNNFYTNAMAKYHLKWVSDIYDYFSKHDDIDLRTAFWSLCTRLNLSQEEIKEMLDASNKMYLPYDQTLGIHAQDDTFLQKAKWDFEASKGKHPLLLHYHPLVIYRHQVLKQADAVLAHFLLEDYADLETIKKSYDYYEAITTHDSSLSACVYGMMAARCGYEAKAIDYFMESIHLDLEDTHRNTKDGLHMANIAGTALSIIAGFAGFRIKSDGIHFRPMIPKDWKGYSFNVKYQGRKIHVSVNNQLTLTLVSGEPVSVTVNDCTYDLQDQCTIKL